MGIMQYFAAGGIILSFALLGRMLAMHESLPAGPRTDHVDSSLHKILRHQMRLEDRLDRLSRQLENMQQAQPQQSATAAEEPEVVAVPEKKRRKRQHSSHSGDAASHAGASAGASAACPSRNPFHTLLTSQGSVYQQWQARIAYHHWKKQAKVAGPCTDMVGFHRLCATEGGQPDGLEGEIPTIFTVQLSRDIIDSHFGFGVLNRPNSVKQLLASPEMRAQLVAPYVLLLETDHVFMKPLPNLATPDRPVAWDFGYMHAHSSQNYIIQKYWPEGDSSKLDPVGPSPCLIHVDALEKLTQRWLDYSLGLRSNSDAERVMQGWVQEMWGYSIAAASVGIKHNVMRELQTEASSLTHSVPEDFPTKYFLFHYTYGIEYTMGGEPQGINNIGEWSLDKRHYGGDHPPRGLAPPPKGANAAARWLLAAWNEASASIPDWPKSHSMGTIGWRRTKISPAEKEESTLAAAVSGTHWTWGDDVRGITFHGNGKLTTPWDPKGSWGVIKSASEGEDDGIMRCSRCLFADFANANHNLRFDLDAEPPTFKAVRVGDMATVAGKKLGAAE